MSEPDREMMLHVVNIALRYKDSYCQYDLVKISKRAFKQLQSKLISYDDIDDNDRMILALACHYSKLYMSGFIWPEEWAEDIANANTLEKIIGLRLDIKNNNELYYFEQGKTYYDSNGNPYIFVTDSSFVETAERPLIFVNSKKGFDFFNLDGSSGGGCRGDYIILY